MVLPAVASAATISESFSSPSIPLTGTTTLTFTIDNPGGFPAIVSFDDPLPQGVQAAGTPTTSCALPALASSGGPSDIAFTDAALTDPSCTVTATVRGVSAGRWENPVNVLIDATQTPVTASVDVVAPPTISAAFGTTLLGLDGTTPLTFTITNPNPSFALTGVSFTDTLPAGLVIAGQPADANGCGGNLTAVAGTDSLGLSDGQLAPGATCTASATVVATATGRITDTTTQVTSTEGAVGNTAAAILTVIGAPTVALASPALGHGYAFGQKVRAAFGCTDDPNGPGIASCVGTVPGGSLIATAKAGSHSFTVTATSLDGGVASDTVFYSVAPNNHFTLTRRHGHHDGSIDFVADVPGPGRITVLERIPGARFVFARATRSARRAGKLHLTITPTTRGRQAVRQRHGPRVTVTVGYTPKGGTLRTVRFAVTA
jgi:uncharacterized repeat protein (TIGR01451 family)